MTVTLGSSPLRALAQDELCWKWARLVERWQKARGQLEEGSMRPRQHDERVEHELHKRRRDGQGSSSKEQTRRRWKLRGNKHRASRRR